MSSSDCKKMYSKIFDILGDLTPLKVDCGKLCGGACCKGDASIGMHLFPFEESTLKVTENEENGVRLAVCRGTCDRNNRPLSCRIFPFFPTVDERGKVYVEADMRAYRLCPLVSHIDEIEFDKRFFKALLKVGKMLAKDDDCFKFMQDVTAEIDTYKAFYK
ncbi:MAG: hypothetical protein IKB72_03935 [Ruminococcus sp.]|nr:hypothetical protein [Ruminococcus sp.]